MKRTYHCVFLGQC